MNIRLGPAFMPSTPSKTKIEGMIIIPARSATPVSKNSIWWIEVLMSTSFFM